MEQHIKSKDPLEHPAIDPRYFDQRIDLEIILEAGKFLRELRNSPDMDSVIAEEIDPGPNVSTDEEYRGNPLPVFFSGSGLNLPFNWYFRLYQTKLDSILSYYFIIMSLRPSDADSSL